MSEIIRKCCKCGKTRAHTVGAGYCRKCINQTKRERYRSEPTFREKEIKKCGERLKKNYAINKRWRKDYLLNHPCVVCGNTDIRVLVMHHRNPQEKKIEISASLQGRKLKIILAEIEKCDVMCANCHAILHYNNLPLGRGNTKGIKGGINE